MVGAMTISQSTRQHRGAPGASAGRVLARRWERQVRRLRESDLAVTLALGALTVVVGLLQATQPTVPVTALVLPMVLGSLLLGPRRLPWMLAFSLVVLGVSVVGAQLWDGRRLGAVVVVVLVGLIILGFSLRRTSLGVAGFRGETMLVDLRDRIHHQARMPGLPGSWYADAEMRAAGRSSFAGDFIVASLSPDGGSLQVAVVDVSGKGVKAGSRALLLSGCFGGLLGALPPAGFLPAANDYLLRQDWSEGFATAVHVAVDLHSGCFELRSAGHPPGVQLRAGSGRWTVHRAEGPVLGLTPDADFTVVAGRLEQGDALLLFTDGLVETARRDLSLGVDKLLGAGERLLRSGFEGGARRLVDQLETLDDDRALLLLHRR